MKRSEMLKIIKEEIYSHFDGLTCQSEIHSGHIDQASTSAANYCLEAIEKAGMTPPAVKVPCPTHFLDNTGKVYQGEDSFVFVNRWDEE